jgi:hypothetical protein
MGDKTGGTFRGIAQDGGIVRPLSEGYIRRGGQVQAPATSAPRPAPPPAFHPAPPPAPSPAIGGPQKSK